MDSSESPTHGEQEGSVWNGHFGCTCYHPLFLFNQVGDLERSLLRPGNAHSAEDWRLVLEPVAARYRERGVVLYFHADAAFAKPEIYELLEQEGIRYAIRLPANRVLQRGIGHLLTRPVGRPPKKPIVSYASFRYQAAGWTRARRVVAKVEWNRGELYPRVGFIVTKLTRATKRVVKFYNGRGTAERHIKEGKNALRWTRLSCHAFRHNAVRLQLHALAYHLANFLRTLALQPAIQVLDGRKAISSCPTAPSLHGQAHEYRRCGTTTLFAALNVATGETRARHTRRRRRLECLEFMNQLVADHPDRAIHVVLDNLNIHKPKRDQWRADTQTVHFHFTPTPASWLNQVEIWFSIRARATLEGASLTLVAQRPRLTDH